MQTNEFNVGDTVQYKYGFTANATVLEVGEWESGGDKVTMKWINGPGEGNTETIGTAFLTVIKKAPTAPTVKSAIEAKAELEKKILEQIQEYNKTYGVVVSDINLRSYSSLTVSGQRDRYFSVEIEVKL